MKLNYLIIPLIVFLVAFCGSFFTERGLDWYETINLPAWTPSGSIIGIVWTVIFILSTVSVILVWNRYPREKGFGLIIGLFLLNGVFNFTWSWLFFGKHMIFPAAIEAVFLGLSVLSLILLIRPISRLASLLLFPCLFWVSFATYLTFNVWKLNS